MNRLSSKQKAAILACRILITAIISGLAFFAWQSADLNNRYGSFLTREDGFQNIPTIILLGFNGKYKLSELENWQRPPGPWRVGLQVGHWKVEEVPEELIGLKQNGSGAKWSKYNERDTVHKIVDLTAELLEKEGIEVDILPATIPPGYVADAFVSVHADGVRGSKASGFKVASSRRDYFVKSILLEESLYDEYEKATKLKEDTDITRNMTGYFAFNWYRYDHAVFPLTPAAIIETGFLTSATDRKILINNPKLAAKGIASGIISFLELSASTTTESISASTSPQI